MPVAGPIRSTGIPAVGSSTDRAVPIWSGTLGDALQAQANLLVDSSGHSIFRQTGGVAGTDEGHAYHDGTSFCIESKDGSLKLMPAAGGYGVILNDGIIRTAGLTIQTTGGSTILAVSTAGVVTATSSADGTATFALTPIASGGIGAGGTFLEFTERTAPSTPAANKLRFYAKDNGSGKTQIVVKWEDGTETVLATAP